MEFTKKQKKDITKLLVDIIQAKENLCKYMKGNNGGCEKCPLNQEDKCNPLNLKEFNFEECRWKD